MNDSSKNPKSNVGSKYTENWIPVRSITNGEIILDNKFEYNKLFYKGEQILCY